MVILGAKHVTVSPTRRLPLAFIGEAHNHLSEDKVMGLSLWSKESTEYFTSDVKPPIMLGIGNCLNIY